jgi:ribonuclease HI
MPNEQEATPTILTDRYFVTTPALLPGPRCYIDASTAPDQPTKSIRPAGLGIFLVNVQVRPTQTIYIRAKLPACSSVLMAEAASLALAATAADRLSLSNMWFLSDSQSLVQFLNQTEQSNPPDWRIKPFTQTFSNYATIRNYKVLKIHRHRNATADALARQAVLSCNLE